MAELKGKLVGVDIGCGMETTRIKESHIEPTVSGDTVIRSSYNFKAGEDG